MIAKKFLLTLFSATLLSTPALGQEVWNGAYEASPAEGDAFSAGEGKIRATRSEVRARMDVEHIVGHLGDITDDNGLHRMGSGRCFMQDAEPTALADSIADYDNTGGGGVTDLNDGSTNSSGTNAVDDVGAGRCWIDTNDNNKLYNYIGVAGDNTGSWVEVNAARIKAGAPNILYHGDFDMGSVVGDGCNTPTTTTDQPLGWTIASGAPTFDYVPGSTNVGQGAGCAVEITDTAGGDSISQLLSNLKASTTYRVVADVLEGDGADICTLTTTGADTNASAVSTGATFATIESFFITDASLDDVTLLLTSTANTDVCTWDHIAVYRQDNTDIPEAGIQMVPRTLTEADITAAGTCVGAGNPIGCCTGAGAGATCDITAAYQDVSDMSIVFTPPTEGWQISLQASVSIGCDNGNCGNLGKGEGAVCRLEKGGVEITASERGWTIFDNSASDPYLQPIYLNAVESNPVAGTEITYTVACRWLTADGDLTYNPTVDALVPDTTFTMIAYPPH
jgi:hypothetical protein